MPSRWYAVASTSLADTGASVTSPATRSALPMTRPAAEPAGACAPAERAEAAAPAPPCQVQMPPPASPVDVARRVAKQRLGRLRLHRRPMSRCRHVRPLNELPGPAGGRADAGVRERARKAVHGDPGAVLDPGPPAGGRPAARRGPGPSRGGRVGHRAAGASHPRRRRRPGPGGRLEALDRELAGKKAAATAATDRAKRRAGEPRGEASDRGRHSCQPVA
jgi:hypothetical protein